MSRGFFLFVIFILVLLSNQNICIATSLTGSIEEQQYVYFNKTNSVIDKNTGLPVPGAIVNIPTKGITVETDSNGCFNLNTNLQGPFILSVKAAEYNPFSLTITKENSKTPLTIGISKKTGKELVLDSTLHHLGDDIFSEGSSNADEFRTTASGASFSKRFYLNNMAKNSNVILKIGSIIGLDTEIARKIGQGFVTNGISSPTQIYLNNRKIGELKINGDDQSLTIPENLLSFDSYNELTVRTGKNLYSRDRTDYDDMEFINLVLEFK